MAHAARPPALLGSLPAPALNAEVSAVLYRCLSPDPAARPTAAALRDILSGRGARREPPMASPTVPTKTAPSPMQGEPLATDGIELFSSDGRSLRIGVRTELGKALVRQLGPDGEFWDNRQCILERRAGRQWVISPVEGTTNETLVNGAKLTASLGLRHGDLIAVGRQDKGLVKLPLTARGR